MMGIDQFVGDRLYLDTNVLIHFVEGHPLYADILQDLFVAIDEETITAVTSELALTEVMIKPIANNRPDVAATYAKLLAPGSALEVRPLDRATLLRGAEIRAQFGGRAFDAIHVASAERAGCSTILSEDRRLAVPPPLQHVRLSELKGTA